MLVARRTNLSGLVLLAAVISASGKHLVVREDASSSSSRENEESDTRQETLQLVTVVMRHGERAPADTYPNDPYVNSNMEPFGWGQLTHNGRKKVYITGEFLRSRYGNFLGKDYSPNKYWLQTTSIDRTKMTGLILSAALWKPDEHQAFIPNVDWQPVSLHYRERVDDRLLLIWNTCPRLTQERMEVEKSEKVKQFNEANEHLYKVLSNLTGLSIKSPGDVASVYSTLKAEETMGLRLPNWTKEFYPDLLEPSVSFSFSMNIFTDNLQKLAGGPMVKKIVDDMTAKVGERLHPNERKMFVYVGHDSSVVNTLSAMGIWDGQDPPFGCTILIELHKKNNNYNVQIFQKNSVDEEPVPLQIPGCNTICPLESFVELMDPMISDDLDEACRVDDPDYVVPPSPPA